MKKISDILALFSEIKSGEIKESKSTTKLQNILQEINDLHAQFQQRDSITHHLLGFLAAGAGYGVNEMRFQAMHSNPRLRMPTGIFKIILFQTIERITENTLATNYRNVNFSTLYTQISTAQGKKVDIDQILKALADYKRTLNSFNEKLAKQDFAAGILITGLSLCLYTYQDHEQHLIHTSAATPLYLAILAMILSYCLVAITQSQNQFIAQNNLLAPPSCPQISELTPQPSQNLSTLSNRR